MIKASITPLSSFNIDYLLVVSNVVDKVLDLDVWEEPLAE